MSELHENANRKVVSAEGMKKLEEKLKEMTTTGRAAIAEKLYMSLRTVKHHIQSMKDKTGFRNRTELAVRARAKGLIINKLQSSE